MVTNLSVNSLIDDTFHLFDEVLAQHEFKARLIEVGEVTSVGRGNARVNGLPNVQVEELLQFPNHVLGLALNLDADEIGVVLLDHSDQIAAGDEVRRTHRLLDIPVGESLIGRVIDPVGRPLDGRGSISAAERRPYEREPASIINRSPVTVPLQTGLKVIDALIPIGRGQRELILGDRQTGKTAIAIDTIINQRNKNVVCIYCAIGQRNTSVAKVIDDLRKHDALEYTAVVVAESDAPPGLHYVAPYAATTLGEYFMDQGRDVLVIYDDLTSHARAYRELSLLLRRPPGREAFPGDIFYLHSRLLERSTHLNDSLGGGSLTALPIAETEAQNLSAYIPTNLISITDGQIYLSPQLFQKGILPAVDVGRSVSRVGGKTQLPVYRSVAGDLRLSYSQFEELEAFSRFSSRLDEETLATLERGRRVREIFKQSQFEPLSVPEQIAILLTMAAGVFDKTEMSQIRKAEQITRKILIDEFPDLSELLLEGHILSEEDQRAIINTARDLIQSHNLTK
ncbi:MAG: alternate F1F0 ATPase, F1 subunit alpha [Planctomycetes bacterium]|nr:alternate F1F0 ATPase, F1 subunit alpha [Planctomycetota bacterium]MCH9727293.1 alternate F1F0 ATPase, F1 subunit alpha [Planctomycetota bacterium]MCH9779151.1 alternate F1F0 ATPase, F1 subunit alpha [Planctomycetota bacterium]MDF1746619.1 alternate F1F0 ATPase, F1 subunit alpha [Gimesia sp.]